MKSRLAIVFFVLLNSLWSADALAAFGRTVGTPNVSATGSAQYSIPIGAPPDNHGVQPHSPLIWDSHVEYGSMDSDHNGKRNHY